MMQLLAMSAHQHDQWREVVAWSALMLSIGLALSG